MGSWMRSYFENGPTVSRGVRGWAGTHKRFLRRHSTPGEVQPLTLLYTIFKREGTPLAYFYLQMVPLSHTMEPLLWDTSPQRTPPFTGYKIGSWKTFHIIFVSVTSIKGTHLFRGKGPSFWVPKPGFNLHSGDTLAG